ncbi:hypothetical protein Salat_1103600, partial [Sesamum alatum]
RDEKAPHKEFYGAIDSQTIDDGFAMDAANFGNVGKFGKHRCSLNLYAQEVVYDHDDKRTPHNVICNQELPLLYKNELMESNRHDSKVHKFLCRFRRKNVFKY